MESLTEAQKKVLAFVKQYRRKKGRTPQFRTISANFGWSSPNAAKTHVDELIRKNRLVVNPIADQSYLLPDDALVINGKGEAGK